MCLFQGQSCKRILRIKEYFIYSIPLKKVCCQFYFILSHNNLWYFNDGLLYLHWWLILVNFTRRTIKSIFSKLSYISCLFAIVLEMVYNLPQDFCFDLQGPSMINKHNNQMILVLLLSFLHVLAGQGGYCSKFRDIVDVTLFVSMILILIFCGQ